MKNDLIDLKKHILACNEWRAIAAEAERLGYASHARDLSPHVDATTRSIKIRTGKLARYIKVVTK